MRRMPVMSVVLASIVIVAGFLWPGDSRADSGGSSRSERGNDVRALPPFQRIEVSGLVEIVLVQGDKETISIGSPTRAELTASVEGNTLHIARTDSRRWWNSLLGGGAGRTPRIVVTFKDLQYIGTSGAAEIRATAVNVPELRISSSGATSLKIDDLQARTLRVSGSGAMTAELTGRVTDQQVSISGAADYRAEHLVSDSATVTVSGAGVVIVDARQKLKASLSGAGTIEYLGDPEVEQRVSGAGRVKKRKAAETDPTPIALFR